jgi:hypothetical protein
MKFLFPCLLERKATSASISVGHKGNHMGPSCKYLPAVFPAADLHGSQWWREDMVRISCNMVQQNHSPQNYWLQYYISM